jgi:hypothetical protein
MPLLGCQASVSTVPVLTTSVVVDDVTVDHAAQDIAAAQCTRELSCGNIGLDGVDGCMRMARSAMREAVNDRCPSGVAPAYLSSCLESIRNDVCHRADAMTERLASSCHDAKLCL